MVELETVSMMLTAGLTEDAIGVRRQARTIVLIWAGLAEGVMPRGNRDWCVEVWSWAWRTCRRRGVLWRWRLRRGWSLWRGRRRRW